MEIGKQIRKLRTDYNFTQDELSEKIYVSRQTISNWENDKSYPDIKSLLLVSNLFNITLDALVKGDVEEMKQEVKLQDMQQFSREGKIFSVLLLGAIVLPVPLSLFLGDIGWGIWGIITALCGYYAVKVEKLKKRFDIQTYKEILAFTEGKHLDNNEKNQEQGKRPYEKILMPIGAGLLTVVVALLMGFLFK